MVRGRHVKFFTFRIFLNNIKYMRMPVDRHALQKPVRENKRVTTQTMSYFSDREKDPSPRIQDEVSPPILENLLRDFREMLDQVLEVFEIAPDHDLNLMQPDQTLAALTARAINAIDCLLRKEKPDLVLVQGDTTTVFRLVHALQDP